MSNTPAEQEENLPSIRELFPEHFPVTEPDQHAAGTHTVSQQQQAFAPSNKEIRKKYVCELCGKRFQRPSSLQNHINSHTGEKPHVCPYPGCNKRFSTKSNMKRHAATHRDLDDAHSGPEDMTAGTFEQVHGGAPQFADGPVAGPSTHADMQASQAGMADATGLFAPRTLPPLGQAQTVSSQSGQPTWSHWDDSQNAGMPYQRPS